MGLQFPIDARLGIAAVLAVLVAALAIILPLDAPQTPPLQVAQGGEQIGLAAVAAHNTPADCWTFIDGKAYDITSYIGRHPGGRTSIAKACGIDATELFRTQGGAGEHSAQARNLLAGFAIGSTAQAPAESGTPAPAPQAPTPQPPTATPTAQPGAGTYTMAQVATHATSDDCWIVVRAKAYDVTSYIPIHPGGRNRIINQCGKDATSAFETRGGDGSHSSRAWNLLEGFALGPVEGASAATTGNPTTTSVSYGDAEAIIEANYPGATILDLDEEDDGRVEAKILYNGMTIKVKIDADGDIREDD